MCVCMLGISYPTTHLTKDLRSWPVLSGTVHLVRYRQIPQQRSFSFNFKIELKIFCINHLHSAHSQITYAKVLANIWYLYRAVPTCTCLLGSKKQSIGNVGYRQSINKTNTSINKDLSDYSSEVDSHTQLQERLTLVFHSVLWECSGCTVRALGIINYPHLPFPNP